MTPLEELQAAHKRLEGLRAATRISSPGHWSTGEPDDSAEGIFDLESSHGVVAEFFREEDIGLVVTLHRTIDAQLAILQEAMCDEQVRVGMTADWPVQDLARAINAD